MNTHVAHHREDSSDAGHLILLGSGPRAEWDQAMGRLAARSPLLLVADMLPSWQRQYVAGARQANLLNPARVLEAATKFAMTRNISGILHFHPAHTRAAELVQQELGLPGPTPATITASTLRHRTAELLERAGAANSGALHADSYDQALRAAHAVGFPLVCKPASPRKRYAARVVEGPAALAEAFSTATAATWPGTGTVIEPRLDGIEATAYALSTASGHQVVAVSHATFDPQAEPTMLPIEVVVDADDVCAPAIENIAATALTAIGHLAGPAQLRMCITATGPRIIGITTHLTDPLIASLIEQVTGVDLIGAASDYARGQAHEPVEARAGASAVRYLQGPRAAELLRGHESVCPSITPYAELVQYAVPPSVGPLRRSGQLLVSGADYPQCVSRLRSALDEMRASRASA
ncbi:hypothetical protein ABZ864_40755 [Streptomyces sp. NPDC047082]|uniref:ATP-grasp domain-containing protein n=1 Tax=Streptomyces sp. NPDC047082 TaxID=3155259 RepID=UPI003404B263